MLATLPGYDTKPWEAAYGTALDRTITPWRETTPRSPYLTR